jgi:hypothetical protein
MSDQRKQSVVPWIIVTAVVIPLLYILSSGPMQTIAFRKHTLHASAPGISGAVMAETIVDMGFWWPTVYAPLWWVSEQSWGEPLSWYWNLFPIR